MGPLSAVHHLNWPIGPVGHYSPAASCDARHAMGLVSAILPWCATAQSESRSRQGWCGLSSIEWVNERSEPGLTPRRPVIVLAEDHDDARRVYSLILRHYGYEVLEATDGESAVELIRSAQPSLVLMDIGLPKI